MNDDPEIAAMGSVRLALDPLTAPERNRVLQWACARYDAAFSGGPSQHSTAQQVVTKSTKTAGASAGDSPDSAVAVAATEYSDFAQLFSALASPTEGEQVLAAAHWLQSADENPDFTGAAVNKLLTNMGHKVPNVTTALNKLISSKPSLVMQVRKLGTTRQARKLYRLTDRKSVV